jgi:hypothetical protein
MHDALALRPLLNTALSCILMQCNAMQQCTKGVSMMCESAHVGELVKAVSSALARGVGPSESEIATDILLRTVGDTSQQFHLRRKPIEFSRLVLHSCELWYINQFISMNITFQYQPPPTLIIKTSLITSLSTSPFSNLALQRLPNFVAAAQQPLNSQVTPFACSACTDQLHKTTVASQCHYTRRPSVT